MEKGNLAINSENILPIIKKWLYSDSDIFIRELVSNSADAISKLKKLAELGEADTALKEEPFCVEVKIDKENKIIQVSDNGIGMTADEIKQYINQIAFSGANDFINKYKEKLNAENEFIGHFGLGFYSAFMVADKVQIDTLSYLPGSEAARWICDGGIEYEMSESDRTSRGTTVTLYLNESSQSFLEEYKLRTILKKYCNFVPVDIYLDTGKEESEQDGDEIDVLNDIELNTEHKKKPINSTKPLWLKSANECSDEEYKEFYHDVFSDFNDPLFWIHLNMDYPFRLKGILYFPKMKHEMEYIEGQVKLYSNQVFIADNIKEVIPEFLLLLKGTLDCPDLPLNVSRSFLQNDGYVSKMSGYITKKVADKLTSLFKKDRENYNKYWDDIAPFIKFGCIKERDFYDKIKEALMFKTINGEYLTAGEFLDKNREKTKNVIFYVSNEQQQAQYIRMFKDNGMDAVILTTPLDSPFISYLESYDSEVKFNRIDSDISDSLKNGDEQEIDKDSADSLESLFRGILKNEKLKVQVENLKSSNISAVILLSEQSRRMQDMSKMFGGANMGMFENEESIVLNKNNNLVNTLMNIKDDESRKEDVDLICRHVYDLAMLSHKPLGVDEMAAFIERSNIILERIANK